MHVEVEIDNGLKRLGGRRALKRIVGQRTCLNSFLGFPI
jgi:hypothetical protein